MTITNNQLTYTKAEALQMAHDLHMRGELDQMRSGAGMFDPIVATGVKMYGNTPEGREKLWKDKIKGPLQQGLDESGKDVFTAEELAEMINTKNKKFGGKAILTPEKIAAVAPGKAEEMGTPTDPQSKTIIRPPSDVPPEDSATEGGPKKEKDENYIQRLFRRAREAYGDQEPGPITLLFYALYMALTDGANLHSKYQHVSPSASALVDANQQTTPIIQPELSREPEVARDVEPEMIAALRRPQPEVIVSTALDRQPNTPDLLAFQEQMMKIASRQNISPAEILSPSSTPQVAKSHSQDHGPNPMSRSLPHV
jgi:hypothetical protein